MNRNHVLLVSHDVVSARMAGPGIRYWEIAHVLSAQFHVTLAVPQESDLAGMGFSLEFYRRYDWDSLAPSIDRADVVVACGDTLSEFPALAESNVPLVVDGYDPHTLESLALWANEPMERQVVHYDTRLDILRRQCQAGDFFICASERQRDWWLGALEAQGRINPQIYSRDPSLRRLVDTVPFGLPSEPPRATRPVLRGVWPGLGPEDQIVLWGGGLWEWLDPLTALRAVRRLVDAGHKQIRLVFPGTRHPNPGMPDMPLQTRTLALADEMSLTDRHAFFGDWVPYEDWPAVLLEADLGLSLHLDTVEARQAFRSRVLDYIWAGLPMVVTQGDAISEIVQARDLGIVVAYEDDVGVANAIAKMLAEPRSARQAQFADAQAQMTWEQAAQPLVEFCREPYRTAPHPQTTGKPGPDGAQGNLAERDAEIARLRDLVSGYEQGRFMRLMRRVHAWREKAGL